MHSTGDRDEKNISVSYWGLYELEREFNLINLNGKLTFKEGRLAETTVVSFA